VAGFPTVLGRELVAGLVAQAETADPTYFLGCTATSLAADADSVTFTLEDGRQVTGKAALITAGIGRFSPRPLPAAAGWSDQDVVFFVKSFEDFRDKDVVIVGGGDSAFDWAHHLEGISRSTTLVHRRDAFRAHQATVDAVLAGSTEVITKAQVTQLHGTGSHSGLEKVSITLADGSVQERPAQKVIAALGFVADLSAMKEWGLDIQQRQVRVDTNMATNIERVFAAGDITDYPGKVRLIAVGFGEAATAVNNAAPLIFPGQSVFPGHSSEGS
ncbi:MAG TPA: NAD(P)/FAD-dependent oxidoreductase, partial [Marmoricola sp.]|nr:NAD(P)/FAD-dependent oxidoreductase [Marmoricola sp.]